MFSYFKYGFKCVFSPGFSATSSRVISTYDPLKLHFTPILMAEPLKKKKRMDPAILKAREEKKKRRLEKQIRRLEKNSKQLKPVDECDVPLEIIDQGKQRIRSPPKLSDEVINDRAIALKQWTGYKYRQYLHDIQNLDRIISAQQRALDELKAENIDLYNAAIQIDESFLPFQEKGPVETPPITNYDSPDGEYIDVSKKWDL